MKISCIVVDDEPVARKVIREFIKRIPYLELMGEAEDALGAKAILEKHDIQLMFLDIQMPRQSGISFLKSRKENPLTIITTAYPNYAVEGFELDILDYLVKPVAFERFQKACSKARSYLERLSHPAVESDAYFFIKCDNRIERIEYADLNFVESLENYVLLHTTAGKRIAYLTLKGLLEHLPAKRFMKVHKSYVVNLSKVKSIEGNELILDDARIPIGQSLRGEVLDEIVRGKIISRPGK